MNILYKIKPNSEIQKALDLCKVINDSGYEALLVGGAVRDLIADQAVDDADIGTNMPISKLTELFKISSNNGEKHGTVLIHFKNSVFEITQYRTECGYSDGRRPDSISPASSYLEDSRRRDFTINAMGLTSNGDVINYHGGIKDLQDGIIRTVGHSDDRFSEDYLRMLRAIRFATRYSHFSLHEETKQSIIKYADKLSEISRERVTAEIQKSYNYGTPSFSRFIKLCIELGILKTVFCTNLPDIHYAKAADTIAKLDESKFSQCLWILYEEECIGDNMDDMRLDNTTLAEMKYYEKSKLAGTSDWWDLHLVIQNERFIELVDALAIKKQGFDLISRSLEYELYSAVIKKIIPKLNLLLKEYGIFGRGFGIARRQMFNSIVEQIINPAK